MLYKKRAVVPLSPAMLKCTKVPKLLLRKITALQPQPSQSKPPKDPAEPQLLLQAPQVGLGNIQKQALWEGSALKVCVQIATGLERRGSSVHFVSLPSASILLLEGH